MSLCLVLERGVEPDPATGFLQATARNKGRFTWLSPPASLGFVTVKDVHRAASATEHERLVRDWPSPRGPPGLLVTKRFTLGWLPGSGVAGEARRARIPGRRKSCDYSDLWPSLAWPRVSGSRSLTSKLGKAIRPG
jgi:hypothetical protein